MSQSTSQDVEPGKEKPGKEDKEPAIRKASDDDLLKALKSKDADELKEAQQEIIRRVNNFRSNLIKLASDEIGSQSARVAALEVLNSIWKTDAAKTVQLWLNDSDPEKRQWAAETLAKNVPKGDRASHEALVQHLFASDKTVRRSVYLAIGKIGAPGAADALGNALIYDDGKDARVRADLVHAIEMLGEKGIAKLLALADSGEMAELARARDAFLVLKTRPGLEALPIILKNYHLTTDDRIALIKSFANYKFKKPPSPDALAKSVKAILVKEKNAVDAGSIQAAFLVALKSADPLEKGPAADLVVEFLQSPEKSVVRNATEVLGRSAYGAKLLKKLMK